MQIVDESGKIVNSYAYDEWGNILEQEEELSNPMRYRGEYYDEESGFYYLRARYYDPTLGRFITRDSYEGQLTNPLSLNLYTYCHNNPLKYVDPSGHIIETGLDVLSAGYSLKELLQNPSWANVGFLAWDVGAVVVPKAPGSYVVKGGKVVDKVDDVLDSVKGLLGIAEGAGKGVKLLPKPIIHKQHIFPVKNKEWFTDKGIDIDQFTIPLERHTHLSGVHGRGGFVGPGNVILQGNWNKKWDEFIEAKPRATKEEIYQYAGKLLDEYGLNKLLIVPYK